MKKKGFTLIELVAVIVILSIILAITVPSITGAIKSSAKVAFQSDAKLVLKAIDYKKLEDASFNSTNVNQNNIGDLLGLSNANYYSLNIATEDNTAVISIIGKDKWDGFIACGTYQNMDVVEDASDCSIDSVPPAMTILGDNPVSIYVGEIYSDAGATAFDNLSGNITDNIIVTGTVNTLIPGTYTITYQVTDALENQTVKARTVNVIDNAYPMITFNPNGDEIYAQSKTSIITAIDLGIIDNTSLKYTWTTSNIEPTLDQFTLPYVNGQTISTPVSVTGSYYLWAMAIDTASNKTVTSSNVFNLDNTAPIITITGSTNVTVNKGSGYIDAGALALDTDSGISGGVISTGSVNPNVPGTYTITYSVSDRAGNEAIPVTRTVNVVDVSAPVITILGDNPTNINVGSTYSDAGATAIDDVDGDVTSKITTSSNVNPNVVGSYTITYTVKDNANNTATLDRTVNVIDNVIPTVAFGTNGSAVYSKSKNTTVTVSDNVAVNGSSLKYLWNTSTAQPNEVSFTTGFTNGETVTSPAGVTGGYYLWILAKDASGNTLIQKTNAFNLDNIVPIITMNGNASVSINAGTVYSDAGATATDNVDGSLTVATSGSVNSNVVDVYTITYNVTDSSGNVAIPVTRTVTVIDATIPTVAFGTNGNGVYAKTRSTTVTVSDAHTGVNTSGLKYLWNTSTTAPSEVSFSVSFTNGGTITSPVGVTGTYYLWILGKDNVGNTLIQRTNVFNLDNTKPIITMNGNANVTVNKGSTYTDAGATASDNIDGTIAVTSTGAVNPNVVGTYTITYNATDSSGNTAVSVSRTINVIDILAPVITLTGSNLVSIEYGSVYNDAGATAVDDVDGNVTSRISTTSTVNTSVLGSYTVTYRVSDTAGNEATLTRTVNVVDTTPPTVPVISGGSTTYATSRTITVTPSVEVASGINRYEYYLTSSATAPTIGTAGTSNGTTLTKTFNTNYAGYYIYFRAVDNVGNIGGWSSAQRLYIDVNSPTITANSASYTITQGSSNALPGTYYTISQNGNATISSTTCIDTSNGNVTVANTSTLAVGTHTIKCTSTKTTGTSAYASTNIVVNPAYTCPSGTLIYDAGKGGYICTISSSSQNWYTTSYQCTSCNTCTYTYPNYVYGGQSCTYCGGGQTVINQIGLGNRFYSAGDASYGSRPNFGDVYTGQNWVECSSCGSGCSGCGLSDCYNAYVCWHGNVNTIVTPCNTCDYVEQITTTGSNCNWCGCASGYNVYNYYCATGWSIYSGSGSSLSCYKAATQQ